MSRMLLALALLGAMALPAAAATPQDLCKDGELVTLRISKLKPGGSVAGIEDAIKDHTAWYRNNGVTDNKQVLGRVIAENPADKSASVSETEVVTLHINPPDSQALANRGDAAWKAFVDKYRKNSEIVTEKEFCLPKGAL